MSHSLNKRRLTGNRGYMLNGRKWAVLPSNTVSDASDLHIKIRPRFIGSLGDAKLVNFASGTVKHSG
jgi:hypothetical protein